MSTETNPPRVFKSREDELIEGLQQLSAVLSRIDYVCDEPNDMQVSNFDIDCNEDRVLKVVERVVESERILREALEKIASFDAAAWAAARLAQEALTAAAKARQGPAT